MTMLLKLVLILAVLAASAFGFAHFTLFAVAGRRKSLWWALVLILSACLLSSLATKPAKAQDTAFLIDGDMGGAVLRYHAKAKIIGRSKVIVDGVCLSACALYLRKDWNLDICYTQAATFGFHKPYQVLDNGAILTGIS
ncbi:hypothetical protein EN788_34685, partial [Mesorhizobium sp. M2D.F.Ca.ET.145.01.1.1]